MSGAVELLEEIRSLMELKGENPFKVRAFEKAAAQLAGRDDLTERAKAGTLTELPGIGKAISEILTDFLLHGKTPVRDELAASLPEGLVEFTQIPGVGPKKAAQLIEELGVHTLGELEYACRENRLVHLKGFGEKFQAKLLAAIAFKKAGQGQLCLVDAEPVAERALKELLAVSTGRRVSETGALRRRLETLAEIEFLVEGEKDPKIERVVEKLRKEGCTIQVRYAPTKRYGFELARGTATDAHWRAIGAPKPFDAKTEEDFYAALEFPVFPPETRETGEEVALAKSKRLGEILPWDSIQGVFHNHTLYSDGAATVEEMVREAKRLGLKYIGLSDHSQSAFYAGGLKVDAIEKQEREIRKVQEKIPEVRVFWGIESDILADGSLDYEPAVLKKFDFVVASVHSRFKMGREEMTERILKAIRNPYTRFLGHSTGRLLLGRPGYELDMERVIVEAKKHDVAIEINANPVRLDIDWRWGGELRRQGTLVSVNPDAHDLEGLSDTRFGVAVARKALLPKRQVINSGSVAEVAKWLSRG